jgi:hypothetical protein
LARKCEQQKQRRRKKEMTSEIGTIPVADDEEAQGGPVVVEQSAPFL